MLTAFSNAALFLINVVFDLYLLILMLRLILFWNGANYFNPMTQIMIKLTQPVIQPIRRFIPNFRKLETSTFVVMIVIEMVKYFLVGLFVTGFSINIIGLIILSFADLLRLLLNVFFYAILLQAILSWVHATSSPVSQLLQQITAPMMRPFQRLVPKIGGVDISAIPALILIQLLIILVVNPLSILGLSY